MQYSSKFSLVKVLVDTGTGMGTSMKSQPLYYGLMSFDNGYTTLGFVEHPLFHQIHWPEHIYCLRTQATCVPPKLAQSLP